MTFDPCEPIAIDVAADTADEESAAIDSALELWWRVAELDAARDNPAAEQRISVRFEEAALAFRGVYEDEIGEVIINRRLSGDARVITVAHELGHALGLPHLDGQASVMNRGNLTVAPLEIDAEHLRERWGACDVSPPPRRR